MVKMLSIQKRGSGRRWKRIRIILACLLILGLTITSEPVMASATETDGEESNGRDVLTSSPEEDAQSIDQDEIPETSTEENGFSGQQEEATESPKEEDTIFLDNGEEATEGISGEHSMVSDNGEAPLSSTDKNENKNENTLSNGSEEVVSPSIEKRSGDSNDENSFLDNEEEDAKTVSEENEVSDSQDDTEKVAPEEGEIKNDDKGSGELPPVDVSVPIYNYEVVNVVAPAVYAIALNPYELPVKTGDETISTAQVVSRKYGILNKSSTDKIVTVTLTVDDLNKDMITFVDSAEAAENADEGTYAVYLSVVPATDREVKISGNSADMDTTAEDLSDVTMDEAEDCSIALHTGDNRIAFRLSKAVYGFENGKEITLNGTECSNDMENLLKISELAPGGGGVTAFTFTGVMNKKADWGKLLNGIRISAVYTYETASGDEKIIEGTGAMIDVD